MGSGNKTCFTLLQWTVHVMTLEELCILSTVGPTQCHTRMSPCKIEIENHHCIINKSPGYWNITCACTSGMILSETHCSCIIIHVGSIIKKCCKSEANECKDALLTVCVWQWKPYCSRIFLPTPHAQCTFTLYMRINTLF